MDYPMSSAGRNQPHTFEGGLAVFFQDKKQVPVILFDSSP